MLSRVAEALFWIGRYVERAEDTARLLDVHTYALLEDPWIDETAACLNVLRVMGIDSGVTAPEARSTTERLAFSRTDTSSIAGSLIAARENASGVRESLSSELWECLNATYHSLAEYELSADSLGPHQFLAHVRERAATITGYIEGTMPHDDGWRFLVLGRCLERVDMTVRLLWSRGDRSAGPLWVQLLKCCSAHEAYLRTYRAAVEPDRVVEFLVLDRLFPRSLFSSLVQAEACLHGLDPASGRTGVHDEALRLLGRARTDLEFLRPAELHGQLTDLLESLQATCATVGDALVDRWFAHGPSTSWALDAG